RTSLEVILLALPDERVDPRLRVGGVGLGSGNGPVPYAGQVGFAVGSARRRRRKVRLAVVRARDARSLSIQPLGPGRDRSGRENERREKQPHIALRSNADASPSGADGNTLRVSIQRRPR